MGVQRSSLRQVSILKDLMLRQICEKTFLQSSLGHFLFLLDDRSLAFPDGKRGNTNKYFDSGRVVAFD